jgi:SprT protein
MLIETPEQFVQLQKLVLERVKFYTNLANTKLKINMSIPKVRFNLKGTTAGYAVWRKHELMLHNVFLKENPEDYLVNTVGHEVAHLAARTKFGGAIKPHGSEWTNTMWMMGLPATRCHNYELGNTTNRMVSLRKGSREHHTEHGIVRATNIGKIIEFD